MAAPKLRAVSADEKPARTKPMTILEAVDAGDRLAELVAMHRRIAKAVQDEDTAARDLAALSRRQIEVSKEIESLRRQAEELRAALPVSDDPEADTYVREILGNWIGETTADLWDVHPSERPVPGLITVISTQR